MDRRSWVSSGRDQTAGCPITPTSDRKGKVDKFPTLDEEKTRMCLRKIPVEGIETWSHSNS